MRVAALLLQIGSVGAVGAVGALGAGAKRSLIRYEISPGGQRGLLTEAAPKSEEHVVQPVQPVQLRSARSSEMGCSDCCNDGQKNVPCADVEECAKTAPNTGKYALILSYVGKMDLEALPFLESAKAAAELANKAALWARTS